MRVAIVHEWLTVIGGSEKVMREILTLFPDAHIFVLVADKKTINELGLEKNKIFTSFIQKLPFAKTRYKSYFPLFPFAIESFDLYQYDLIISSSHSAAKGVLTFAHQTHICYCHSPVRYAWDLHHQYLRESKLNQGLKGILAKYLLHRFRNWDYINSGRVDYFIANSNYIAKRIKKNYGRDSVVIYPNVETKNFPLIKEKENFYIACSRMVPYKKIDLIVNAFNEMPNKQLYIIGDGPDFKKIKLLAKSNNIIFLGRLNDTDLASYLGRAKAFVFAAEEDFGILPIEAQSCGTPVIAYKKGGVSETVIENLTGIFFDEQKVDSIIEAVQKFELFQEKFDPIVIHDHAQKFNAERFKSEFLAFIKKLS
jgi:glycosyltransferase involved in cell wall biosynthesis